MSIERLKPFASEPPAKEAMTRGSAEAGDFAAVARDLAAGDLTAARAALSTAKGSNAGATATLAQSLAAGNLAAARLALAQLGADPSGHLAHAATGRDAAALPVPSDRQDHGAPQRSAPPLPGSFASSASLTRVKALDATAKIAAATRSAAVGGSAVTATAGQHGTTMIADAGTLAGGGAASYSVADVMLALATGNAGSIPADVINLYGPGGARYDPAAIMDAYRNSDIGRAQMAMFAWMTRQA